ncbi:MAG TPA: alpha/beta fold hydrolase [Mycobacteriales bacterium]|jgi:polyhydroxyalkanoate synthase|nr:alpha/beta fold hydrolase [Mycobacteriales bacterium]
MAQTTESADLVSRVRRDVGRNLLRARNGVKYVTGIDRPQVGTTPKDTVWRRDRAELWHYRANPEVGVTERVPVLIVMSLISRSYVLDLYPGMSFVAALRDAGFDVYMLDWGIPDERDAGNGLTTYVDDLLPPAIDAVLDEADADAVNVIGYCYGGLLSLLLGAAHPDLPVASLVTMATPVDFSEMGMFGRMFDGDRLGPDDLVDETGNVPPDVIRNAFRVLKPTAELTQYAVLWEKLWDDKQMEGFQVMGQWTRDHIPFPGRAFRETVEIMRGGAVMADTVRLGDRRISLKDMTWPLLNIIAGKDHIVPRCAALPVVDLVGATERRTLELPAGHVGLVMGRSAATTTMPQLFAWLRSHTDLDLDLVSVEPASEES